MVVEIDFFKNKKALCSNNVCTKMNLIFGAQKCSRTKSALRIENGFKEVIEVWLMHWNARKLWKMSALNKNCSKFKAIKANFAQQFFRLRLNFILQTWWVLIVAFFKKNRVYFLIVLFISEVYYFCIYDFGFRPLFFWIFSLKLGL